MAFRKVQRRVRDEAGNVVGGPNFEVRIYSAYGAGTLAALKLDLAGADARANPGQPNSGWSAKLTTQLLGTDASAIVDSTAGVAVGDAFPIVDGLFFHYLVVKAIPDATHITLEQTPNAAGSPTGAHPYPIGAVLNGPSMYGHWQGYVSDVQDYDLTVKNLTTGVEGSPDQLFTTQNTGIILFQEEGVSTGAARGTLNGIGAGITLTDNPGSNRVDLTHIENQTYITTAAEATLSNERVLGTTVIAKGTLAGRPAASTSGYLYFATDGAGGTAGTLGNLYRDTGAAWELVATNNAVDAQPFTATGTWTKPTTFTPKAVLVICFGAGGGGGGGYGNSAGTNRDGGGGGGGGACHVAWFDPSTLGATETVTVGAGGTGGPGGTSGNGTAGGVGGTSSFGAHLSSCGGGGGGGGTASSASGAGGGGTGGAGTTGATGAGGAPKPTPNGSGTSQNGIGGGGGDGASANGASPGSAQYAEWGGAGGACGTNTGGNGPFTGASSLHGGGGGGGGGGVTSGNVGSAGGAGGQSLTITQGGGGAGGAAATIGTAGTSRSGTGKAGNGSGGGGGNSAGTGAAGAVGGAPSGGAGGGGAGTSTGGAGGVGGRGEVLVYTFG